MQIIIDIQEIPHGHGRSFRRGVADGLLEETIHESESHSTHSASYQIGVLFGENLKLEISKFVKD